MVIIGDGGGGGRAFKDSQLIFRKEKRMEYVEVLCQSVYDALKRFSEELSHIDTAGIIVSQKAKQKYQDAKNQMQEQIKKNEEKENILNAFLDIAIAHASNLIDTKEILAFDVKALSKLTVQINYASKNDPFAGQLFTQASAQLRAIRRNICEIQVSHEEIKRGIEIQSQMQQAQYKQEREQLMGKISAYFSSKDFQAFVKAIEYNNRLFGEDSDCLPEKIERPPYISIGIKQVYFPVPNGFERQMADAANGLYNKETLSIGVPVRFNLNEGSGMLIDYRNENEHLLLSGLQNFLLNVAKYHGSTYRQIVYVDPVRFSNYSLGILQPLAEGRNSFIDSVPLSIKEVREKLNSIMAYINTKERSSIGDTQEEAERRLLIFHNFPNAYDSAMVSQIQQLFVNAAHYQITVIVTHNCSVKNTVSADALVLIRMTATNIECTDEGFAIKDKYTKHSFQWYSVPAMLPNEIRRIYVEERQMADISDDYEERVGFSDSLEYEKGCRKLISIPYGIDMEGKLLSIDFENSNFATFVCGAARCGKSNLLHVLLTGIIKNIHPDDVELWLVDFKMTEFSRYINHLPPHVRYIILDESPELVYDIIDKLTDIMAERQNLFKGKWLKLDDVPKEQYMPAILVMIDEFSVMARIMADSLVSGKDNYRIKLQMLLSKGAALGLHFIFASQGFADETAGLTSRSKKQIQQRIAMQIEYNEIKETLDLKSATDEDRKMMEEIQVHHALLKTPINDRGGHLLLAKVLHISDYRKQETMIDGICKKMVPEFGYDVEKVTSYRDKKTMIIDGNHYISFHSKEQEIHNYLQRYANVMKDGDEAMLFVGEPRRMIPLYPMEVINGFCENILMVAARKEKMPTVSVLMSIVNSLEIEGKGIEVWVSKKNAVYGQMEPRVGQKIQAVSQDLEEVCTCISKVKEKIQSKIEGDQYIILLGFETLMLDMGYQENRKETETSGSFIGSLGDLVVKRRESGQKDLLSRLESLKEGEKTSNMGDFGAKVMPKMQSGESNYGTAAYDARNDLKFILKYGPRLGYHFIMLFHTVGELKQSKLDISLFKHKILFQLPKSDAMEVIGSSGAGVVSELESHSFRYTNGLDALSFRPYLHPGLSWDGWRMGE